MITGEKTKEKTQTNYSGFGTGSEMRYSSVSATAYSRSIPLPVEGAITPNQIPLTVIVTYLQNGYRSRISNHWAAIPACSVVPPHLQTVQENILSHIILATYRKFTVATIRFTQNVSCNIYTHPRYQQVANVTV